MRYKHEFLGELLGTFLLVLFGCGSVAVSILFDAHQGLFQTGMVWGIGVTLAIYATRHLSCAHLNPAVSVAMVLGKRMGARRLPAYITAQFAGAFLAAAVLYMLMSSSISSYEDLHEIIRGSQESVQTAMIFVEYYPNPTVEVADVSFLNAFTAEAVGTFLLVLLIFILTEGCNVGRPDDALAPVFIGLTVASIICLIAPLTQAGINPARDLGPRMFAWLAGWRAAVFPDHHGGFFFIYVLAPILGGSIAAIFFVRILEPAMAGKSDICNCKDDKLMK
jgi:glycerol uptake facilitator protein